VESIGETVSKGVFQVKVTGLIKNTTYYFRGYATVDGADLNSEKICKFTTKDTQAPTVKADSITGVNMNSASLNGGVTSDGGEPVVIRGLCWGLSASPTITSCIDTTINGSGIGKFIGKMTGLTPGTQYYARTYASNAKGVAYDSVDIIFKTHNLPSVTTTIVTGISNTGAISGGNVTDDGGANITAKGICWGTSSNPTIALTTKTSEGTGKGIFTSTIAGLTPLTTYYLRAYATNQYGTSYGNELTLTATKAPIVITNAASSILNTSAVLNGTVNANSFSSTVTFEYGLTTSYGSVINAMPVTVTGTSATSVLANIGSLNPGITYHFRIKAVNEGGIAYGDDHSFTTLQPPSASTNSASGISSTTATLNGSVNANNYSSIVTFEYGITASYGSTTTAVESPVTGNTPLAVNANITGLTPSTTYHYRVKAVSTTGTSLGNDDSFTTSAPPTTVTDIDGNIYNIVRIGTQTWMNENLKTTLYNNGDPIPSITDNLTWAGSHSEAYCWYNNNEASNKNIYGALYTIYAAGDVRNICPTGWHTGSDEDWTTLTDFLSGVTVAGGKLKESGTTHWGDPNTGATNSSGMTIQPGGNRSTAWGTFSGLNIWAGIWFSQNESNTIAGFQNLNNTSEEIYRIMSVAGGEMGMSVRCIKRELPLTETVAASAIASTTVTLNGKVNPNGVFTTVTFEYGITSSYGSSVDVIQSPASGNTPVNVNATVTSINPGSTYHFRIKAVNSGGTSYGSDMTFTAPSTLIDADGNVYNAVLIGTQIWMKENLKTLKYSDGSVISGVWAFDNNESLVPVYGRLYVWNVLNSAYNGGKNVCPLGWHVSTIEDFNILGSYLGDNVGGKIKEEGTSHWLSPNTGATNETGFSALPSGVYATWTGTFMGADTWGTWGGWWTSNDLGPGTAYEVTLYSYSGLILGGNVNNLIACPVRCVKD
jgi:uncharacterized protein (TIGR02145 family)